MICRYCGKTIPEGSVFCPFCGNKTESHLRKEDRDKEIDKEIKAKDKKAKKTKEVYVYEEPKGKRRVKAFISIIAAIIFVAAAFIAVMVFVKPYLGEEPWPDEKLKKAQEEEVTEDPKTMYVATEEGLILRKEPGTESEAIHLLNYGLEIQVDKIEDGWAHTTVDGFSGWCSAEYLTENKDEIKQKKTKPESKEDKGRLVEPSTPIETGYHGNVNSDGGLNLRCGPGEDYDILMVVPDGTEVVEEGWEDGWIYIKYDGQYGWVNSEYVTPTGDVEN